MISSRRNGFASVLLLCTYIAACDRVDQKTFDAVYRSGKAIELDLKSGRIDLDESEKLVKQLKTEVAILEGRGRGARESAALKAYAEAADAYRAFLDMRSFDLRGDTVNGRLLVGEGWVAIGSRFGFNVERNPPKPGDEFKWYWVRVGEALDALRGAATKNLAEASRLVNGD